MSSNVPTRSARLTCATRRSYPSMSHIQLLASSATALCKRFTQFQVFNLREAVSTQPIIRATRSLQGLRNIGSDLRLCYACYTNDLTRWVHSRLEPIKGSHRAASRIARGVAAVIGISLSIPMSVADSGSIDAIQPKEYVRIVLPKKEAICLSRLIGKESAWNHKAVGNLSSPNKNYVYGLLQLKNPIVKDKSPIEQIHYGLKYIDHRYQGNACNAWEHWKAKGWH
jgi:hypothetical protein